MIVALLVVALLVVAVAAGAPIVAALLVSVASRSEDSARTLGEPAPGLLEAAARRILDFRTECADWPLPKGHDQVQPAVHAPEWDEDLMPSEAEPPWSAMVSR